MKCFELRLLAVILFVPPGDGYGDHSAPQMNADLCPYQIEVSSIYLNLIKIYILTNVLTQTVPLGR